MTTLSQLSPDEQLRQDMKATRDSIDASIQAKNDKRILSEVLRTIQLLGRIERHDYEDNGKQYFIGTSSVARALDGFLTDDDTYQQGRFVNNGPRVVMTIAIIDED